MIDARIARRIVELMNEALELDPIAMNDLYSYRVPVSSSFTDHPSIQVGKPNEAGFNTVGLMGILNGIAGADDRSHWGAIAAIVDTESGKLDRFEVLERLVSPWDRDRT